MRTFFYLSLYTTGASAAALSSFLGLIHFIGDGPASVLPIIMLSPFSFLGAVGVFNLLFERLENIYIAPPSYRLTSTPGFFWQKGLSYGENAWKNLWHSPHRRLAYQEYPQKNRRPQKPEARG